VVDLYAELQQLIAALESAGLDYAICGGVALAVHGVPRATQDIDILLRPEDMARLREAARGCGFVLESLPMDFSGGVTIQRFTKLVNAQPLMLDVLLVTEPLERVWATRQRAPLEGGGVLSVVSREGLITLKLAAGRPQDVADVKRLEEVGRG